MSQSFHRHNAAIHAERRVAERFNAGPELVKEIKRIFKKRGTGRVLGTREGHLYKAGNDEFLLIAHQQNRCKALVFAQGRWFVAVYDKRLKELVTVFPKKEEGGDCDAQDEKGLEKSAHKGR